ncbi:MAG: 50S ribosomal protein L25 [Planctomycetaceae bacterium]|nr:50S ribosomal protein L25 [Planctomycetaceae bacterium]
MSTEAKLLAEPRAERGSRACHRLRLRGLIPGNVYGHQTEAQSIVVREDALRPIIQAGIRVVDLDLGGKHDKALLRDVSYDAFGRQIEHFDLMRVDATERVTLHVPIVLKGTAPGSIGSGHVLEQPLHTLTVDCLAIQIPDSIVVKIGSLQVGQAIHVRDLELPADVHVHNSPDAIIVHIVEIRIAVETPVDAAAAATQPEVIVKKPAEEEAEKGDKKK